jgi:hypothetical protein
MVLSLCLASFWIAVSLQVVDFARLKCAVSVLGYALVKWFYRGSWLRSVRLVQSCHMATFGASGSIHSYDYAPRDWFSRGIWLRSSFMVLSAR